MPRIEDTLALGFAALVRATVSIPGFDDILTGYFDDLPILHKLLAFCRVEVGLRLLQAIPLADTHTFGWIAHASNYLASGAETPTAGRLLHGCDSRCV